MKPENVIAKLCRISLIVTLSGVAFEVHGATPLSGLQPAGEAKLESPGGEDALPEVDRARAGGWTGTWRGQSAEAQYTDGSGGGRVVVFQTSDGAAVNFAIWSYDPTSYVCTGSFDQFGNPILVCTYTRVIYDIGWGLLPSSGVEFGSDFARLYVNAGSTVTVRHCLLDRSDAEPVATCTNGAAISFDVTWTVSGLYETSGSGPSTETYGSYVFKNGGGYQGSSAFATGNVNDHSFADAPGSLNDTKGGSVARAIVPTN